MKPKYFKPILAAGAVSLILALAMPAFGAKLITNNSIPVAVPNNDPIPVSVSISASVRAEAEKKIDERVNALNELRARISGMKKISDAEKTNLVATIDSSVEAMVVLKAKIDADTDNAIFKADVQSITKGYRIYLLVLPQARLIAAGDRALTIRDLMGLLGIKLQARINTASDSGKDVTTLKAILVDYNVKLADSEAQAQSAINQVVVLSPDNGDKIKFEANEAALKEARAKIKVATADLRVAREDAKKIIAALKSLEVSASATGSTTVK